MRAASNIHEGLESWFKQQLSLPLAARLHREPVAIRRYWQCIMDHPPRPEAIRTRHPAMENILPTVEAFRVLPSKRTWSRGRRCRFYSWKAQHTLRLDSTLEMDHARICEIDPEVTQIVAHPFTIQYQQMGRSRTYTPDLFVMRSGRRVVREVKDEADAASDENTERWPYIANALNRAGFDFEVVTNLRIRSTITRNNIDTVFNHRMTPLPSREQRIQICIFLSRSGEAAVDDLRHQFSGLCFASLLGLVRHGFAAVDISQPIDERSTFSRGPRPKSAILRTEMFNAEVLL